MFSTQLLGRLTEGACCLALESSLDDALLAWGEGLWATWSRIIIDRPGLQEAPTPTSNKRGMKAIYGVDIPIGEPVLACSDSAPPLKKGHIFGEGRGQVEVDKGDPQ
jgi:hypothetical protein